ncbi:MAG: choice-of-anchor L domain-containing protein [Solirubrobacteraceae bacterium]
MTILRLSVRVPGNANCLSFRFRFLSQEFPKYLGSIYNDGFIAELDQTTWTAGTSGIHDPHISAPRDFAKDSKGNIISIHGAGPASMRAAYANGTTYGGATQILRASTPITPGVHSLFLSIFDQGDRAYDSAVFIDNLTINRQSPCTSGVSGTQ